MVERYFIHRLVFGILMVISTINLKKKKLAVAGIFESL